MRQDHKSVVLGLAMVLVVLSTAARGRSDSDAEARTDGLLGIAVADAVSGRPIGKAAVGLWRRDGVAYRSAVSDANGVAWVHLTPGEYQIYGAAHAGYAYEGERPIVAVEQGMVKRMKMALTPNLRGVVRDPRGTSVGDAWVTIVGAGCEEATSDGQGRFEIGWNRRCQFRGASTFCLVARQEQQDLAAIIEIGRETTVLEVKLQPGMTLTGRIVDPDRRGIGGACVYATWDVANWGETPLGDEQTKTDDAGKFEIRAVPPGARYTLHACADKYGSKDLVVDTKPVADRSVDVGPLTLPSACLSVAGRVRDTQGNPVAHATMYGWGAGQPLRLNTRTDAEGRFTLPGVCAGRIELRVDADWRGGQRLQAYATAAGGDTDVQITPLHPFGMRGPISVRMSAGPAFARDYQDIMSR